MAMLLTEQAVRRETKLLTEVVTLKNKSYKLSYWRTTGRVIYYGSLDGPNLLWRNLNAPRKPGEWANFGGDKLWLAPESLWGWPPDPDLDGSDYDVTLLANGFVARSPVSKKYNVRLERRVTLDPKTSLARFENKLTNVGNKIIEMSIWQVAQVAEPDAVILPIEKSPLYPKGYAILQDIDNSAFETSTGAELRVRSNPRQTVSYTGGALAGYVAAERANMRFVMRSRFDASGVYPDRGRAQQVSSTRDNTRYAELELCTPLRRIAPGKSMTQRVKWEIISLR